MHLSWAGPAGRAAGWILPPNLGGDTSYQWVRDRPTASPQGGPSCPLGHLVGWEPSGPPTPAQETIPVRPE